MKTAISLPDDLYARGERAAQRLGRTRSSLYAEALARYLAALPDDDVTAALDELYADHEAEPPAGVAGAAAARSLIDAGDWPW